jgi:hypothetical protein|tara:strand:+ start:1356 stop:1538 length:183 start_codon:yes stop_codon:yes gene_type:complete
VKKIFNLVSSPRSGSTIIYNALCSNDIFNPALPESHFASDLSHLYYKQLLRKADIEKNYI